jgi:hypothetical protein
MSPQNLRYSLCVLGLLSFAACSHAGSSPTTGRLLAAVPASSDVVVASVTVPRAGKVTEQLPADVQQDPAARMTRLQQIRMQVINRVKALDEDRYVKVVRSDLGRQLLQLGFDDQDVTYFLTDLDRSRR